MCCCIFNLSISFLELIDLMEFDDEEPFNSLMKYISELKLNGTSVLDETTDLVLMYGLHIYALKCLRFKYKRKSFRFIFNWYTRQFSYNR